MSNIELHLSGKGALQQQVYEAIRSAVSSGRFHMNERLPSSRSLAKSLAVSRMTTQLAYERLVTEGYLTARQGAGTFVASQLSRSNKETKKVSSIRLPKFVKQLERLSDTVPPLSRDEAEINFSYSQIDRRSFPALDWRRSVRFALSKQEYTYPHPMGVQTLREVLQAYLRHRYGLICDWRQIMIVSGSQQGLQLCTQTLTEPGNTVAIEEPGYAFASLTFDQAGLKKLHIPVDTLGMQVDRLARSRRLPSLAYVTPGHQFPLGGVLPMERRLELLNTATEKNFWIIEDDYDSEYRHDGAPLPPLKVLDDNERVIHVGTFSKTIDPGMRLGYMVLPKSLVKPFTMVRVLNDQGSATLNQLALAHFIQKGWYDRHLRRIRKRLGVRRAVLMKALTRLDNDVSVEGSATGSHVVLWLKRYEFSETNSLITKLFDHGVFTQSVGHFYATPPERVGLLLGYGSLPEEKITEGVDRLADCLSCH